MTCTKNGPSFHDAIGFFLPSCALHGETSSNPVSRTLISPWSCQFLFDRAGSHQTPRINAGACISPARSADTLPSCPTKQGVGTGASGLTRPYLPCADAPRAREDTGESSVQGVFPHADACMSNSRADMGKHTSQTVSLPGEECLCASPVHTELFSHTVSKPESDSPPTGGAAFLPPAKAEGLSPRSDDGCFRN